MLTESWQRRGLEGPSEHVLGDGTAMSWCVQGQGPDLVLVHGWAADLSFFDELAECLAPHFRVWRADLRGHGATPVGPQAPSIDLLADDLADWMAAQQIEDALVVAWSMGAMVTWSMIERHGRDRLSALVIEDMSPRLVNDRNWSLGMVGDFDIRASLRACAAMQRDWPAYVAEFAPRMFARGASDGAVKRLDRIAQGMLERDPVAMASLWKSMCEQDFRPLLPSLDLPVSVMAGQHSQAYSLLTARYLADTLPHGQLEIFDRSGHAPHLEELDAFAARLRAFASTINALTTIEPPRIIEGSIS
ncbi:alpha/beta fold hydrolase [Maricaulis sp. CAU 1757]